MNGGRLLVRVGLVALLMLAVAAGVGVALAAPLIASGAQGESPQIPTLVEVLTMLASGAGVGAVLAFLFERMGWFQKLPSDVRWWVILGMSLGLPMLSTALLQFVPPNVWAAVEPYWRALATGFLIWAGSQVAHRLNIQHALQ